MQLTTLLALIPLAAASPFGPPFFPPHGPSQPSSTIGHGAGATATVTTTVTKTVGGFRPTYTITLDPVYITQTDYEATKTVTVTKPLLPSNFPFPPGFNGTIPGWNFTLPGFPTEPVAGGPKHGQQPKGPK
jgi:hypothetical protein